VAAPFLVQWFCRALHTLESGVVTSKREASEWALDALGPQWSVLVQQALDDRPEPWQRVHQAADAERDAHSLAFVDYAIDRAGLRQFTVGAHALIHIAARASALVAAHSGIRTMTLPQSRRSVPE
jgi:hypothetical protein